MRIAVAIALVVTMGGSEIDRAQQVARSRDAEREPFHHRYVFNLTGETVTQLEVITEFRRLVTTTEDHLRAGDQMFSRGTRAAEEAMAPTRGLVTFKSQLRFHPQNAYVTIPAYKLALGPAASSPASAATSALTPLETKATGEFSQPFRDRSGKNATALLGATIEANLPASRVGQTIRALGVMLDDKDIARVPVDFGHLD
jgi:hypothetical protein